MGVPNVVYKWKSLRKLYVSVFVMNVAGCVIVVIMIVSAVKLRLGVSQYLDLVLPGDANFWPGMMFLIGFLCAPIYAIGARLCFHLRFMAPAASSVPRLNQVLFVHCLLCLASTVIVIVINVVGILRMVNINRVNHNGIMESMEEYGTEVMAKVRIDMIQISFQCCGRNSFKDWFNIRWMQREETLEAKELRNETSFVSTDVPFSCCATDILRPCIHHDILKPSEVYLYQPEHRLTIATTGCHAKLLSHARHVGGLFIVALFLLATYQMILAFLSRLLQTAHSNFLYIGPRKDRYLGWILGSMPNDDTYHQLVFDERDSATAEELLPLHDDEDTGLSPTREYDIEEIPLKRFSSAPRPESLRASSSSKTSSRESQRRISSTSGEVQVRETLISRTISNSIPTPPPSPGSERLKTGSQRPMTSERECQSRTAPGSNVRASKLKELRESLVCLEKYQSPWKGGSPSFQAIRSSHSLRQSFPAKQESKRSLSPSSSSSSSDYKKHKVRGTDSAIREDEIRMKKFCKDLSNEYKSTPYSKQRRDFSEQYRVQEPLHRSHLDAGRSIRNEVYARFNPSDTYSRFRGSVQDTIMRRESQTHPGPPPIPISDQKFENRPPTARPVCRHVAQIGHQRPGWAPRCPPAPTYLPVCLRPSRPPRPPPCPYRVCASYQPVEEHFRHNECGSVGLRRSLPRCSRGCGSGINIPPRFL